MTAALAREVGKLTPAEKLQLVEDLWAEVAAADLELPVPESHRRVLEERLVAHLKSPRSAVTLGEFRRRLGRRL